MDIVYINTLEDQEICITTVFKDGPSTQAVRIPKKLQLESEEVWIERVHNGLLIRCKPKTWDGFFMSELTVTEDFDMARK